ncbi:hypothetical protein [Sphingomonas sp. Leaf343]|uniref:hypothetical protein n=1 Tax=Sphingomonas sp. Leaf343 TaxID=1736345 RepID=UPI000AF2A44A|nr:hypothetical protein [Sphingomonas sp. Leaf343]
MTDLPFTRRPWPLFATIAATFVALFLAVLALPHDPYIRFQQLAKTIQFRSQWVYERIALDRTPIDIAIVGNSRLGAGVSAPQVQARLRRLTGSDLHVANLTMPQEGRNIHYAIVKRLIAERPELKLIVLSVIEQMPREGHPAFRDLADVKDVLDAPLLLNRDYANDIGVLPFRQISLFVQSLFPAAFGDVAALDRSRYPGSDLDSAQTFRLPDGKIVDRDAVQLEPELAAVASARVRNITRPILGAAGADYEFAVERAYTRRIAALTKAHGVSVMFLYLPIYKDHEPVSDQKFYDAIGPTVSPGFVADDYRLYSDYGHLNVHGSRLVAPWLADRIAGLARRRLIRPVTDR